MVNGCPLEYVTKDVLAALVASHQPPRIFVRGGALVTVRSDENDRAIIAQVGENQLRHEIARACRCKRTIADPGAKHVPPPLDVVRDLAAAPAWPFPPIVGITAGPMIRADGSVCMDEGDDDRLRTLYVKPRDLHVPPIPESPTREDAIAAVKFIDDAIGEFPFSAEPDRANAIALLATPALRQFITGCVPFALIDAPAAGTGKSLFGNVVATVTTGRPASLMLAPRDDDEWRKRITAALCEGALVINVDNIEWPLGTPSLAAALTACEWNDRALGTNSMVRVQQRSTWPGTGNNIRLRGDMPRRCYRIRLDPKVARPWQRTGFRHADLIQWVSRHRGELLAALLTLARAWIVAGKPAPAVRPLGSFESWTVTVGGVLEYAGVRGFLANLDDMYAQSDDDSPQWAAFLGAWSDLWGPTPKTVAAIADEIQSENRTLREVVPDELGDMLKRPESFRRRLGLALRRRVDTRYGDDRLHIRRGDDRHARVAEWSVEAAEVAGSAGSWGSNPVPTHGKSESSAQEERMELGGKQPPAPRTPCNEPGECGRPRQKRPPPQSGLF